MIEMLPAMAAAALVQFGAPPAPPIAVSPRERQLQAWLPGEVRCDGRTVEPVVWRRPYLASTFPGNRMAEATYRFELDATGRPGDIKPVETGYLPFAEDIGPSLAASRFRVEGARADCTVTYTARLTGPTDTPVEDAISYTLTPTQGQLPREWWQGIFPGAATCDDEPRPAPLTQSFPDFSSVPGTQGVRDWTMFSYDLDASGTPINIRVLTGTRNQALDVAGAAALGRSRYTGGPRTGCRFPFWKAPEIMPAPPAPEIASFRKGKPPAGCEGDWASKPALVYPDPYRRRSIEGWAVIGYDLAPWGGTGNVRILAAEPAADFGLRAAALIREAKRPASAQGAVGCIERVFYRIERPGTPANSAGD